MAKQLWQLTLKTTAGTPLGTFLVEAEPHEAEKPNAQPRPNADGAEAKMTEPQRRYLFRLLALQGVEGKAAEDHLKEYFKVKVLKDVSKAGASHLIDQMVTDMKEAGDGQP